MSKRTAKPLIIDMLQCVDKLLEYTAGHTYESFELDSKTKDAVVRNIQVLGEAANKLPADRSRHIVTHEYSRVDYSIIWKIATIHSLPLKLSLEKILKEI